MKSLTEWQDYFENWWHENGHNDDASHDIGHFRRVYNVAVEINTKDNSNADELVLLAAAYFHDLVNPPKNSSDRSKASTLSAQKTKGILQDMDFPKEKLDSVSHAIIAHSFSANIRPETIEAKIIQDADRMESLGAIGIARTMYVSAKIGSNLFDSSDPLAKNRPLNDTEYALDHFETKLLKLSEAMQTKAGQEIAVERSNFIKLFQRQIVKEIGAK